VGDEVAASAVRRCGVDEAGASASAMRSRSEDGRGGSGVSSPAADFAAGRAAAVAVAAAVVVWAMASAMAAEAAGLPDDVLSRTINASSLIAVTMKADEHRTHVTRRQNAASGASTISPLSWHFGQKMIMIQKLAG